MKRNKRWWSNLDTDERSELIRLERIEAIEDRCILNNYGNNSYKPDNWCAPDIICGTEYESICERKHLLNLRRITELIEKADGLML